MKLHPEAAKVRVIIAAYREKTKESPFGPGYGPDWKKKLKGFVVDALETGKEPYFMRPSAPPVPTFAFAK